MSCQTVTNQYGFGRRLSGQRALVTGADSGIGAGIARALAAAGARVAINYLSDPAASESLISEIATAGGEAFGVKGDVGSESQVREMFDTVIDTFGAIDVLVNNAGIRRDRSILNLSLEDWNEVMRVNLTGQFLCSREAIQHFINKPRAQDTSASTGKIICISSVNDRSGWAYTSYAASKGGVMRLMQSLAQEVAPYRIRVNAVSPGAIRTNSNRAAWDKPEAEASLLESIPFGRMGSPEDVGRVVVWLASDESDYITGATLYVDGGMTLAPGVREGG